MLNLGAEEAEKPKRIVIVSGDYNYPPYEFLDSDQFPHGYAVELTREIANLMGFEVQFHLGKWAKVRQWLESGEVDLIQGMAYSRERSRQYHFSNPHTQTWRAVFVRKDSKIKSVNDLVMASIVLQQGDIAEDFLREINYLGNKIEVPSQSDALQLLNSGKYDAAIVNYMNGRYIAEQFKLNNLTALEEQIQPRDYCFASLDLDLINDINAGISMLRANGRLAELHDKWFSAYDLRIEARKRTISRLLVIVIPLLILLISTLIWVWLVKHRVKKQTYHLRRELIDRLRIENELRMEYKLFVSGPVIVFKAALDPIRLILVSENVSQYGWSSEELIDKSDTIQNFIHPDDQDKVLQLLNKALQDGLHTLSLQMRIIVKDGSERWVFCYALLSFNADGSRNIYGYLTDITIQKDLEKDLFEAKEKAETANIAKGHFLANMSHEIRTPLNGIMGFIQVLQQQKATVEQREYYSLIFNSGRKIMLLVKDVLDFSRIESGRLELQKSDFSIKQMIEDVIKGFIFRREKPQVELRAKINDSIPDFVNGDMLRLRQVFINLIQNGIKYTQDGWVEVSADVYTHKDTEIRLLFSVSDTGIGMDPSKQRDIFDSYLGSDPKTAASLDSSGLGLSIVKKMIEIMGGFIWVESEPMGGSSFFFIIPFMPAKTLPDEVFSPEQSSEPSIQNRKSLRILLVEDEPINQVVTRKMLERWNHHVTLAENGEKAVQLYEREVFDCILMDIQMPVKDGVSATREIRALEELSGKHTVIYAFTAAAMVGDSERFIAAGMDDYISKPVDTKLLSDLLNKVMK